LKAIIGTSRKQKPKNKKPKNQKIKKRKIETKKSKILYSRKMADEDMFSLHCGKYVPFKIKVGTEKVDVFIRGKDDSCTHFKSYNFKKIFIGKDSPSMAQKDADKHSKDETPYKRHHDYGNTILLNTDINKYLLLSGVGFFTFETEDEIVDFYSPQISRAPYPFAIGTKNVYNLRDWVYVDKEKVEDIYDFCEEYLNCAFKQIGFSWINKQKVADLAGSNSSGHQLTDNDIDEKLKQEMHLFGTVQSEIDNIKKYKKIDHKDVTSQ
jgi:hypothetical protein